MIDHANSETQIPDQTRWNSLRFVNSKTFQALK